jgi:hypothetical protein
MSFKPLVTAPRATIEVPVVLPVLEAKNATESEPLAVVGNVQLLFAQTVIVVVVPHMDDVPMARPPPILGSVSKPLAPTFMTNVDVPRVSKELAPRDDVPMERPPLGTGRLITPLAPTFITSVEVPRVSKAFAVSVDVPIVRPAPGSGMFTTPLFKTLKIGVADAMLKKAFVAKVPVPTVTVPDAPTLKYVDELTSKFIKSPPWNEVVERLAPMSVPDTLPPIKVLGPEPKNITLDVARCVGVDAI